MTCNTKFTVDLSKRGGSLVSEAVVLTETQNKNFALSLRIAPPCSMYVCCSAIGGGIIILHYFWIAFASLFVLPPNDALCLIRQKLKSNAPFLLPKLCKQYKWLAKLGCGAKLYCKVMQAVQYMIFVCAYFSMFRSMMSFMKFDTQTVNVSSRILVKHENPMRCC